MAAGAALLVLAVARSAESQPAHSRMTLHARAADTAGSGDIGVALRIQLDPGWHTYWINGGDAGFPLSIDWHLPEGFVAGSPEWPAPRLQPFGTGMSYGYTGELVVTTRLSSPHPAPASATIAAVASWLVCADVCIPTSDSASLLLVREDGRLVPDRTGSGSRPGVDATLVAESFARVPAAPTGWEAEGRFHDGVYVVDLRSGVLPSMPAPYFFVDSGGVVEHSAPQRVTIGPESLRLEIARSTFSTSVATRLSGILVSDVGAASPVSYHVAVGIDSAPGSIPEWPTPPDTIFETGGTRSAAAGDDVFLGPNGWALWMVAAAAALVALLALGLRAKRRDRAG